MKTLIVILVLALSGCATVQKPTVTINQPPQVRY